MLPLQLIPHSWASTSAAHVITCLTSFFPPVYKLKEGSNLVILFTVVSPVAVTLPGSETQESCWINDHADCEAPSECLFSFPHGDSWQLQTCWDLSGSLLQESLWRKNKLPSHQAMANSLVQRRVLLPFACGISQKCKSLVEEALMFLASSKKPVYFSV